MRAKAIESNTSVTFGGADSMVKLFRITINTKGATANTCTVTDVNTNTAAATIDTTVQPGTWDFGGAMFQDGFTVALASGTAAKITVVYE